MRGALPGLLQPWGILVIALIFAAAFFAAYRWHRANVSRPHSTWMSRRSHCWPSLQGAFSGAS